MKEIGMTSLPITPLRGVVLPGLYNYDGYWRFGLRKDRVKRLFHTPWAWFDKPILKHFQFEIGLNCYSRPWRLNGLHLPTGMTDGNAPLSFRYRESVILLLGDHYDLKISYFDEKKQDFESAPLTHKNFHCVWPTHLTPMLAAHSKIDGGYVGDPETALMLLRKGIAPQLAKPSNNTCSIGFCERQKKWYGWSHRAMYGFGIGSKVEKGSCGYVPETPEELIDDYKAFFSDIEGDVGPTFEGLEILPDRSGARLGGDGIVKCGRGEWTAKTLDDAKQMAIDFAEGVS